MKFTSIFFATSASILEIYLKETYKQVKYLTPTHNILLRVCIICPHQKLLIYFSCMKVTDFFVNLLEYFYNVP